MAIKQDLIDYSEAVLSGKIIACQKHKWACLRFLNDLKKENTDDFPYIFNEEKAQRFLNWMKLFKHRKGILKGQFIEPHIIQKFVFGNVYGWHHRTTGLRRFNKFYWQVARKNAKSQSLATVGTFETMARDETEAAEVYCAATKTEQAKIVYDEAVAMLKGQALLKTGYNVAYGRITHKKSGSVMRALSEEDRKNGDGLNPQCGIIDEYHAHETSEIYDVIDSGMGARAEPLLAIITTAGFDLANPCYRVEYDLISKILDPDIPVNLETYFVMVNELDKNNSSETIEIDGRKIAPGELIDDIKDEKNWIKANPIICSYPEGVDYLRNKLKEALEAPEKMRNLLTKHFNTWVNQRECGYMQMDRWAACLEKEKTEIEGKKVFGGLDLSSTIDLTSFGVEIPLGNEYYYCFSHSFIPEQTLDFKIKRDKVPYDLWIRQGYLTLTEGAEVDYHFILEYIVDLYKKNKWPHGEICFDKALATWLTHELTEKDFIPVEIPQSFTGLSTATKDFRAKVLNKKIIHNGDPLLTWAISNAVTRSGPSENIMLDKSRARNRIDPIASIINAHARAMLTVPDTVGYNERGMRSFI